MNIAARANIAAREPVATRELRQAARQKRGPLLLAALGVLAPLGGMLLAFSMASPWTSTAEIGRMLFEVMFTVSLGVAVIVGVTAAASSVASEREGHTWEAVLLSGLRPSAIVRGKFLSAFAQAALYLFALAPSAALSFLVGGVAVTEIILALGLIVGVAAVAVLFGLGVSSFARTARGALAGALVGTLVLFPLIYAAFLGLGYSARSVTTGLDVRGSTWLAHALITAPWNARTFVFFVLDPLLALAVPGWLIFEVTKANLSDASDDRSSGLRRWYIVGTLLLVGGALATMVAVRSQRDVLTVMLLLLVAVHLGFSSLVFGGEPRGPSRRILLRAAQAPTSFLRRFLAPGIVPATVLHACLGAGALGVIYGVSAGLLGESDGVVWASACYAIAFHLFTAGLTGALAARLQRPLVVRGVVAAVTVVLCVIPFVVASIGRNITEGGDGWRFVEALSPFSAIIDGRHDVSLLARSCTLTMTLAYGILGVVLVILTWTTTRARTQRDVLRA